jgi:acetoacetyl-CoA synthetase
MYLLTTVHLIHGARLILYDGSPFYPTTKSYLNLISQEKVTMLGTSPKWIGEVKKQGLVPRDLVDLSSIRVLASTGMVLPDELFRWIYQKGFPPSVHLENVSGGTDIAGAFACGNSITPVYVGGMQGPQLGVAVAVFEEEDGTGLDGRLAQPGTAGELVITTPFPNMPTSFWGPGAAEKYFKSYFEKFKHVWTQGDNVLMVPGTRRLHFVGRSDGVLNPAGIRFGSSEIYTIIEHKFPKVVEYVLIL